MTNIDWDPVADELSTAHVKPCKPYPERERIVIPPRANWLARVRCWLRGYHKDSTTIGRFAYSASGDCVDCGLVGSGDPDHGDTEIG